jgi:regulator of replication initiation timing
MFVSKKKLQALSDDMYELLLENTALRQQLAKALNATTKQATKPKKATVKKEVK